MRIIKNTSYLLISDLIAKGFAFFLIPIYSYLITPSDFGVISILQILYTFFYLIFSFSLKNTVDKFYFDTTEDNTPALISNVLFLQSFVLIVCTVLFYLISDLILAYFQIDVAYYLDIVIVTCILGSFYPLQNSILLCLRKVKLVSIHSISTSLVRNFIALILVYKLEDKILAVLLANLFEHLSLVLIFIPFFCKYFKIKKLNLTYLKKIGRYSISYFPTTISNFFIKFSDRIMIQTILGYEILGIYTMASKLVNIPGQIISTINKNFMPEIYSALSKKNHSQFNKLSDLFLGVVFLLIFSLIVFGSELFYFVGANYKDSYLIYLLLLLCSFANSYNLIVQPSLMYYEKYVKIKSLIWLIIGVINIGLNFAFIPYMGSTGAAVATGISYLLAAPISVYYANKAFIGKYNQKWFLSVFLFLSCSVLLMRDFSDFNFMIFSLKLVIFLLISFVLISRLNSFKDLWLTIFGKHGR